MFKCPLCGSKALPLGRLLAGRAVCPTCGGSSVAPLSLAKRMWVISPVLFASPLGERLGVHSLIGELFVLLAGGFVALALLIAFEIRQIRPVGGEGG